MRAPRHGGLEHLPQGRAALLQSGAPLPSALTSVLSRSGCSSLPFRSPCCAWGISLSTAFKQSRVPLHIPPYRQLGYAHTCTQTQKHKHTDTQRHTHRYKQTHTDTHIHTDTYIDTNIQTYIQTHRHIHIHRHTHTHRHTNTHTHIDTHIHIDTHRHTKTHKDTQTQPPTHAGCRMQRDITRQQSPGVGPPQLTLLPCCRPAQWSFRTCLHSLPGPGAKRGGR